MSSRLAITGAATPHKGFFNRHFHVDWLLLFSTLVTVGVGLSTVHSTETAAASGFLVRQSVASAVGCGAMLVLMILPYQIFRTYARPLYVVLLMVLVGVLVFGTNLRGTRGWFHLGPVYLQSSEVAKPLFVLTLAGYLDRRIEWYTPKSLIIPFLLAGVPILLIVAQPDFSSSLVFFPATLVMFYVAGARSLHLISVCFVGALSAGIPLASTYFRLLGDDLKDRAIMSFLAKAFAGTWQTVWLFSSVCVAIIGLWWVLRRLRLYIPPLYLWTTLGLIVVGCVGAVGLDHAIKDYQRRRLVAFISPELDPLGGGYNVRQSQIAIGSGQILGKGYARGTQSQLGFLPSRNTDFIFSVIGEELGFVRAVIVLFFYFMIIWRGFDAALVARDRFGGLVASGFASMFAFYALLNLGMTMGMAPVAGVPLPMVSYGGSSVVSSMISIGILLSIHLRRYML